MKRAHDVMKRSVSLNMPCHHVINIGSVGEQISGFCAAQLPKLIQHQQREQQDTDAEWMPDFEHVRMTYACCDAMLTCVGQR